MREEDAFKLLPALETFKLLPVWVATVEEEEEEGVEAGVEVEGGGWVEGDEVVVALVTEIEGGVLEERGERGVEAEGSLFLSLVVCSLAASALLLSAAALDDVVVVVVVEEVEGGGIAVVVGENAAAVGVVGVNAEVGDVVAGGRADVAVVLICNLPKLPNFPGSLLSRLIVTPILVPPPYPESKLGLCVRP